MPSFKGIVDNGQCFITVHVHPPQSQRQKESRAFRAIIDTGAQRTCISQRVISALDLLSESKVKMKSTTGTSAVNQYQLGIFIPIEKQTPVGIIDGKINIQREIALLGSSSTVVMEFKAPDNFDVIIGMDMLSDCNLFVAHGEFFLSF